MTLAISLPVWPSFASQKAKLLGFPNYAAWKLEDQMAKTPEAALKFMDALVAGRNRASR